MKSAGLCRAKSAVPCLIWLLLHTDTRAELQDPLTQLAASGSCAQQQAHIETVED